MVILNEETPVKNENEESNSVSNSPSIPLLETTAEQVNIDNGPSTSGASYYNPEKEIEKLRNDNNREIEKINYFFVGLVVFVVLTFTIQIYVTNLDRIKDKDLYLRYNENYQSYSEKNIELIREVDSQKNELNRYNDEFEDMKKCIKNFGFTIKCFE